MNPDDEWKWQKGPSYTVHMSFKMEQPNEVFIKIMAFGLSSLANWKSGPSKKVGQVKSTNVNLICWGTEYWLVGSLFEEGWIGRAEWKSQIWAFFAGAPSSGYLVWGRPNRWNQFGEIQGRVKKLAERKSRLCERAQSTSFFVCRAQVVWGRLDRKNQVNERLGWKSGLSEIMGRVKK